MPTHSPFQIEIPETDLLTYLFPPSEPVSDIPIWIDADDTSNSLSPRQALEWIKRLGFGLQDLGLKKQDVVLVYTHNHIFVPVAYLGIAGSGFIFSGCNPAYGVDETAYQIENTECKAILVEPTLLPTLLSAASKSSFPQSHIFLFSDKPTPPTSTIRAWTSLLPSTTPSHRPLTPFTPTESRTTIAALNYSSGTTGLPKGVKITHANLLANTTQSLFMRDLEQPYTPTTRAQERWLSFLPLYHAYGQLWTILAALRTRSPCYMLRAFNFPAFLQAIESHAITHIQTAPPVLVMLSKRPETARYDISSLRNVLCGAAPLARELQNDVSERFGVRVCQTWGMTEVTCSGTHVPGGREERSGAVGFVDPNSSVKLVDEEGREVGVGERGEVFVKGPNVCVGYWRNEGATKELFDGEGYLRTGDVAVRDEEGLFWIVDRKKELIKVKGFQVAPAELEAGLLEHEGVGDAAVCGVVVEHEELPRAYVVLKDEYKGKYTERDVEEWMAKRVARHKQLSGGVIFIDEVPKSPSGKIQRKILREWAKKDAEKLQKSRSGAKL
ncbi:4-coumarate-CoA ligase [Corynespora cassiicola Philippines]|uniref:4-coumarate-CoA ligase n=1 Tax=Corynespora cassiicola Philippines TaxID=1448308 RepID=A0A2T2PCE0_CORCC|nr:4-coumarate-CoA ligase [Corynespora cassiicola Philippines]